MFTAFFLQKKLKEELEKMFEEDRFPDKTGNKVKLNIYEQFLPVRKAEYTEKSQEELESGIQGDDTLDEKPFPYILVILPDGVQNTRNKPGRINVILYISLMDKKDENRAGYEWLLHIIQKICERFQKNVYLGNYKCGDEILFELSVQDEHPCYSGAVVMEFETPAIVKEDRYC